MVTLALKDVEARYGSKVIYARANMPVIQGGALTALVGPNAAGKSTLFRRIAGQLRGRGSVQIEGAKQRDLRYMPQETGMDAALTVYESIILSLKQGTGSWSLSAAELLAVDEVLTRLRITDLASKSLTDLSGGQRQLVSIAQTLVTRPKVLLMDEPTSALDLFRQHEVLATLRDYVTETSAVAILALHDLNQVMRCCTQTVAVADGDIIASGQTLEVLTPVLIRRLYGVNARIEACSRGCPMMIVDGAAMVN